MGVQTISIDLSEDIISSLNKREPEKDIKLAIAIYLYQAQKLSIGKASQLAGFSRLGFENFLSENQIPVSNLSLEEIMNDAQKLI